MKNILLIIFIGCYSLASSQMRVTSSSQNTFPLKTEKLGTFYVTNIQKNENGKKSEKCIINGNPINCDLISKCKKGDCSELESYLITNKILETSQTKKNKKKDINKNIEGNLFVQANVSKKNIYVGEQILVTYKFFTRLRLKNIEIAEIPELNGFWVKDLKENSSTLKPEVINGIEYYTATIKKSILTAQKSGELFIDPLKINCWIIIQNNNDPFANFFGGGYEITEQSIASKKIKIDVKELPYPPDNFKGAVGNMSVKSEVDRNTLNANDALTYKLIITGTGNIELLEKPIINFPEDFEIYDPKITEKIFEGGRKRSVKTYEYLLIPRYEGSYKIPSNEIIVYNTKLSKYETKQSSEHLLEIKKSNINEEEYVIQKNVKKEKKDINYISLKTNLKSTNKNKLSFKLFYITFFLPLIILLFLIFYKKRKKHIKFDTNKNANKIALKKLTSAQKCIKENNYDSFFEEIEKALWGYFSDKFKVSVAKLSKDTISTYFNTYHISKENKNKFIKLLDTCELARYTPTKDKSQKMDEVLHEAKNIIVQVEIEIK